MIKPSAFITSSNDYRHLNPTRDSVAVLSYEEAIIVFSYNVGDLKVFCINEKTMSVMRVQTVWDAFEFYE